jgi:alpha-tubulin suppressor-like RCC1 family protein
MSVYLNQAALRPEQIPFEGTSSSVASGINHLCAVMTTASATGNLKCMGLNTYGQCGDGTNNPWMTPMNVYLDVNENPVLGQAITLGEVFTCALTSSDNIKCFGRNNVGQIGNTALQRDETYRPFDVKLNFQY